ncbi:IS982 family transposase, partial [Parageobacillus toebii]
ITEIRANSILVFYVGYDVFFFAYSLVTLGLVER